MILDPSKGFKPIEYPWALEFWKLQQQLHWTADEIPMDEDVKDWNNKLSKGQKENLSSLFLFFTQSDVDVANGYHDLFIPQFKNVHVRMMMSVFAHMETIHIDAYSLLMTTVGMSDGDFTKFNDYKAMADKHDYISNVFINNIEDLLLALAIYAGFTEGLQLFGSFAMLLNYTRHNLMKGMGQIVKYSIRDESLHVLGMITTFLTLCKETTGLTKKLISDIQDKAEHMVTLEDNFIELGFIGGEDLGLTAEQTKQYIRYTCNHRLSQMGIKPIYNIKKHPLPWLPEMINSTEHTNFFENKPTNYTKNGTTGNWNDLWS
ncbi:hypothetical protein AB832_07540 [Flavobacteriaceae bacterium (ex Bugula neritina AB1)]|nr:hypothetical protein AB832_07540 [Flavobacteriaceae bacterium (ex Bugula neritina AB1)]